MVTGYPHAKFRKAEMRGKLGRIKDSIEERSEAEKRDHQRHLKHYRTLQKESPQVLDAVYDEFQKTHGELQGLTFAEATPRNMPKDKAEYLALAHIILRASRGRYTLSEIAELQVGNPNSDAPSD